MEKIIQNAIQLPSGRIINSTHRHDYISKEGYMIDGGIDYFRSGGKTLSISKEMDLRITEDSPFSEIKYKLVWGTRGKNGDMDLKWVKLRECETDHLISIVNTQFLISPLYLAVIFTILRERGVDTHKLTLDRLRNIKEEL